MDDRHNQYPEVCYAHKLNIPNEYSCHILPLRRSRFLVQQSHSKFKTSSVQSHPMNRTVSSIREAIRSFLDSAAIDETVEIEARLGLICDRLTGQRITFNTLYPVIFGKNARGTNFRSGVSHADWRKWLGRIGSNSEPKHSADTVSIFPRGLRMIESSGQRIFQKKERINQITIYMPEHPYDVRVSFSSEVELDGDFARDLLRTQQDDPDIEMPSSDSVSEQDYPSSKKTEYLTQPMITRRRDRKSFQCSDFSFDFTRVATCGRRGPRSSSKEAVYEVEVEVTNKEYDRNAFVSIIMNMASTSVLASPEAPSDAVSQSHVS